MKKKRSAVAVAVVLFAQSSLVAMPLPLPKNEGCYPDRTKSALEIANQVHPLGPGEFFQAQLKSIFKPVLPLVKIHQAVIAFQNFFTKDFEDQGLKLQLQIDDEDVKFNAFAWAEGDTRYIRINGKAISFQPLVNIDVVALLLCHELGHHSGGFPFRTNTQGSAEGQADYYATSKCMRRLLTDPYFAKTDLEPDPLAVSYCTYFFAASDRDLCGRTLSASIRLASIDASLDLKPTPSIASYDKSTVTETITDFHPSPQCRLDTMRAGGFCRKSEFELMTNSLPNLGVCHRSTSTVYEIIPSCWYARGPTE